VTPGALVDGRVDFGLLCGTTGAGDRVPSTVLDSADPDPIVLGSLLTYTVTATPAGVPTLSLARWPASRPSR
jgi:hypothetical protein